jgi:hypothetical protein
VGRYFLFGICLAVLLAGNGAAGAQTQWREVENSFQSPPDDARAMMRWWWFGPAVTQPELKREMGQMKAAGFGGFEIQPFTHSSWTTRKPASTMRPFFRRSSSTTCASPTGKRIAWGSA